MNEIVNLLQSYMLTDVRRTDKVFDNLKAGKSGVDNAFDGFSTHPYHTKSTNEEGNEMTNLFKVIETEEYGTFLTKDSQGRMVLELKGSNKVASFFQNELEEVVPYTIDIQFKTDGSLYTFTSKKGVLEVDDLVVYEGPYGRDVAQVKGVDTKNKKANKSFKGWKLNTTRID